MIIRPDLKGNLGSIRDKDFHACLVYGSDRSSLACAIDQLKSDPAARSIWVERGNLANVIEMAGGSSDLFSYQEGAKTNRSFLIYRMENKKPQIDEVMNYSKAAAKECPPYFLLVYFDGPSPPQRVKSLFEKTANMAACPYYALSIDDRRKLIRSHYPLLGKFMDEIALWSLPEDRGTFNQCASLAQTILGNGFTIQDAIAFISFGSGRVEETALDYLVEASLSGTAQKSDFEIMDLPADQALSVITRIRQYAIMISGFNVGKPFPAYIFGERKKRLTRAASCLSEVKLKRLFEKTIEAEVLLKNGLSSGSLVPHLLWEIFMQSHQANRSTSPPPAKKGTGRAIVS